MKISIVSPNLSGCVSILDCGVTYLATYINARTAHEATIWDYTYNRRHWQQYVRDRFAAEKPDAIGITFTTLYEPYVRETINLIRAELSSRIPIVVGGIHATLKPAETMAIPGVDYVVLGEGEETLAELLDALAGGGALDGIAGLMYRRDGRTVRNPDRPWIADINALPFPNYDLWADIEKYFYFLGQLWLIGTRGCPYNCTNCEELPLREAVPGRRYRVRDARNYVEEIQYHYDKYKNIGFRMAHPFDPVFPLDREWTRLFCEEYVRAGLNTRLPFSVFSRGDTFYLRSPERGKFDEERLRWLAEAGCKEIRIGIEAGSERVRNEIHKKGVTDSQLRESFAMFRKYGMITIAYNMLGGPTETKRELIQTFRMNRDLKPNKPIFFVYQQLTHDLEGMGLLARDHETAAALPVRRPKAGRFARKSQDRATIQFGEPLESAHYSKTWIMAFQYFCYMYFVARRVLILVARQKHRFFINFVRFMARGRKEGANMKIVFAYFLSSSGENLLS